MIKFLNLENLNPFPEEGFKPLIFRETCFDTSKKFINKPKTDGSYAFFKIKGDKVYLFKTDNYFKAFNFNLRSLDFSIPKKTHIGSLTTIEFVKYKLLRSLENFTHTLTRLLAHKPKYFYRLCRKLRYWLTNFAFKAAFNGLKPFCKVRKAKTRCVEIPAVLRTRQGLPKATKVVLNDESDSDSEDYVLPFREDSSSESSSGD